MKRMDQDKMKAYKIAYITDQLDLTAEEAQKFWPIYNEISNKIENFRRDSRKEIIKEIKDAGGMEDITDAKAFVILKKDIAMKETVLVYEKEMMSKLQQFLSHKKILKLQVAEREFKRKLFNELKKRRKKFKED
jgi:hypothetical protein